MTPSDDQRGILLDIEGTTSSISFVFDVMFPFVRREVDRFLKSAWKRDDVQAALEAMARDAGHASTHDWLTAGDEEQVKAQQQVVEEVHRLMDDDVKATGLKQLQGLIWEHGFTSGELRAHLYPDVVPALQRWTQAGHDIRIYSSGSVHAQRLFFGHTLEGDVLPFFRGHYDTTVGPKRDSASYQAIAQDFALPPSQILFLSDVPAELDAARQIGMATRLCRRPGNAQISPECDHAQITSFAQCS